MLGTGEPDRRVANGRIVVVGASLAGLRAAEQLRAAGFAGDLHLVGAEHHAPYNRPPLSKGLLVGDDSIESTALSGAGDLEARWWLGREARALDLGRREVMLAAAINCSSTA